MSDVDSPKKQGSILRGIAQGISWVILLFLAFVAIAVIVVPALTHSTPYTILTSSMVPTYPPGTLVIVKPIPIDDIHIGTVVTYQLESLKPEVVTHRVVAIVQPNLPGAEATFVTKGDANDVPDAKPVQYVQIRGAVWYSVPYIGWINNLVNGDMRSVLIPIAAGALFLYAGYQFVSGRLERKRERRELAASKAAAANTAEEQGAPEA
jgi:signal peptidase